MSRCQPCAQCIAIGIAFRPSLNVTHTRDPRSLSLTTRDTRTRAASTTIDVQQQLQSYRELMDWAKQHGTPDHCHQIAHPHPSQAPWKHPASSRSNASAQNAASLQRHP